MISENRHSPARFFPVIALLLVGLVAPLSARDEVAPLTPAELIAKMKADCAKERARLGSWATGKKLGVAAKAQFLLAVRLDPGCRRARRRLGHRKQADGSWDTSREKEWEYGRGAVEKYGEEFRTRERELLDEELSEFERLGLSLLDEAPELAKPLLLRVLLLAPGRGTVAEALGLESLPPGPGGGCAYARKEVAQAVRNTPDPQDAGITGIYAATVGTRTITRRCVSVVAETVGNREAADELAEGTHRAVELTCRRFGYASRGIGWINIFTAPDQNGFNRFIDGVFGPDNPQAANHKRIGSTRGVMPRHFAGCIAPMNSDRPLAMFCHVVAEHILFFEVGQEVPAFIFESAGIDACIDLLGVPGNPCVVFEESAGMHSKDAFESLDTWGSRLLRRAATGDMPHLAGLLRAKLTALGAEDLVAGHGYYKFFVRTRIEGLREFLNRIKAGDQPEDAFAKGFGASPEEVEEEYLRLIMGG